MRIFDIIISALLLVVLSPIFVLIYVMILVFDKTNPIFTQFRIGKDGKLFKMYKFKTMQNNSDTLLFQYLQDNPNAQREWDRYKKLKNDPRVTKIGKILRKTSLDELPQLFNVLKLEMALVGPRPYLPQEIDELKSTKNGYKYYIKLKPGITGLWQVNGRNEISFKKRVLLDIWYYQHRSIWLDLCILVKTVAVILNKKGY
ncbi:MAG: sugar transferase [Epsilonproteobacteria bacterium]|nr:sugar transferase [Campylobacterota bacterium]